MCPPISLFDHLKIQPLSLSVACALALPAFTSVKAYTVPNNFLEPGMQAQQIQTEIVDHLGEKETLEDFFGNVNFAPDFATELTTPISNDQTYNNDVAFIVNTRNGNGIGATSSLGGVTATIQADRHSFYMDGTLTNVSSNNGLITARKDRVKNINLSAYNIFLQHEAYVLTARSDSFITLDSSDTILLATKEQGHGSAVFSSGGQVKITSQSGSVGINSLSGPALEVTGTLSNNDPASIAITAADSIFLSANKTTFPGAVSATNGGQIDLQAGNFISATVTDDLNPLIYAADDSKITIKANDIYLKNGGYDALSASDGIIDVQGHSVVQILGGIYAERESFIDINTTSDTGLTYLDGDVILMVNPTVNINTESSASSRVVLNGDIVLEEYFENYSPVLNINFGTGGLFNGAASLSANSQSSLTFGENSVWYVQGDSQVSSLSLSSALIDLTAQKADNPNLTVDTLKSTNGTILVNVSASEQTPLNGKLKVTSSASGNLFIHVPSSGTSDGQGDSGVLVETPTGQSLSFALASPAFSTDGTNTPIIDLGVYNYELITKDIDGKTVTYLTPYIPKEEPTPDPGPDPKPEPPALSPSAIAVLALAGSGSQTSQFLYSLSDLRKRMGDVRHFAADGLYASIRGGKDRISGFATTSFKNEYGAVSIGYDRKLNDNWIAGVAFETIEGEQTVKNYGYRADGEDSTQSLKAYATWFNDIGCYMDFVIAANIFDQDISTHMLDGTKVDGSYNSKGVGVSAEVGKKFSFGTDESWFIEPLAQLAYYRVEGEDFRLSNGMSIEQENADSLTGRLGITTGLTSLQDNGTGYQISMKAGVNHEFLGDADIWINGERFSENSLGTRGYYGVGFDWYVSEHMRVYGQIEREEGAHFTSEINARLGLKYHF